MNVVKVSVDRTLCMGHGQCYARASEVYEPDEDGFCVVTHAEVSGELTRAAIVGAEACPESAITVAEG